MMMMMMTNMIVIMASVFMVGVQPESYRCVVESSGG